MRWQKQKLRNVAVEQAPAAQPRLNVATRSPAISKSTLAESPSSSGYVNLLSRLARVGVSSEADLMAVIQRRSANGSSSTNARAVELSVAPAPILPYAGFHSAPAPARADEAMAEGIHFSIATRALEAPESSSPTIYSVVGPSTWTVEVFGICPPFRLIIVFDLPRVSALQL